MQRKVNRGSTAECLKVFSDENRFNVTNIARCRVRNQVCTLLRISASTGHAWFARQILPTGVNMFKLQLLLEVCGFEIKERQNLTPLSRALADQVALNVLSVGRAASFIGSDEDKIVALASGREGASPDRISRTTELVEMEKPAAESRMEFFRQSLKKFGVVFAQEAPSQETVRVDADMQVPTSTLSPSAPPLASDTDRTHAVHALAHLVLGIKHLAARVASDEFTPAERDMLRRMTGNGLSNAIFDLSNIFHRLCGERARSRIEPQATATRKEPL